MTESERARPEVRTHTAHSASSLHDGRSAHHDAILFRISISIQDTVIGNPIAAIDAFSGVVPAMRIAYERGSDGRRSAR